MPWQYAVFVRVLSCTVSTVAMRLKACVCFCRLASDPGIVSVMAKHQFTVGMLAEMPPEVRAPTTRQTCSSSQHVGACP